MKIQTPIEIHASLRYRCPNINCGLDHWITLQAAKTKKYKIVCDCNFVFYPKLIKKISLKYKTKKQKQKVIKADEEKNIIPDILLQKSSKIMQTFGFTKLEADTALINFYLKNPIQDYKQLVQNVLANKE